MIPTGPRRRESKLALLLPQLHGANFSVYEVAHAEQIHGPLSLGAHEQVPPNRRRRNRVVNKELKRTVNPNKLLNQVIGTGIRREGPGSPNGKPPSKRPSIGERFLGVRVVSAQRAFRDREPNLKRQS